MQRQDFAALQQASEHWELSEIGHRVASKLAGCQQTEQALVRR